MIPAWDPFIRLFHWGLVVLVTANLFFNKAGKLWHQRLGYVAAFLVFLRFLYGCWGPTQYRWTRLFPTWSELKQDVRDLFQGKFQRHIYHAPLASVVMMTMMILVILLGLSGWLTQWDMFWGEELLEELHEILSDGLLFLSIVHIMAVWLVSWKTKEWLVLSMIHGKKRNK
jgi:cytochrome b